MIRGRPRSLRGRLVWGVTLLAAAAVLTAQTIGFLVLHSWLLNRVDQQLSGFVLPDRADVTMAVPFMRSYCELLVKTCHRRGAQAMGGMAAFIPSRRDPDVNNVRVGSGPAASGGSATSAPATAAFSLWPRS